METAHCRIRRVRMKNGGADVRVLPSSPTSSAMETLRGWANQIAKSGYRPDAVAAVAYIWDDESKRWSEWSTWHSEHPGLPPSVLPAMAEASLREDIASIGIEASVMRTLGYEPDGAA